MGGSINRFRGRRLVAVLGALTLGLVGAAGGATSASADDSAGTINPNASGSIVIHKYERQPGTGSQAGSPDGTSTITTPVVKGVLFTAYQLTDVNLNVHDGWDAVQTIKTAGVPPTACDSAPTMLGTQPLVFTKDATTDDFGIATISPLVVGAYLVCETSSPSSVVDKAQPFLVTIPYPYKEKWLYNVHVYPKNGVTGISKTVDAQTVLGLGATAKFPVTTKVPKIDTDENFTHYWVHDQMPSQITPASIDSVTLGSTALTVIVDYKVTTAGKLVTVEFTQEGLRKLKTAAPADLVTMYTGAVTSIGSDGQATDTAYVSAATKVLGDAPAIPDTVTSPTDSGYVGTASAPVTQNWGDVAVHKVDAGELTTGVAGAVFEVYAAADPYPADNKCTSVATSDNAISVGGAATFTTNAAGLLTIAGLFVSDSNNVPFAATQRCYVLKEITAPAGYITPTPETGQYTAVTVKTGVTNYAVAYDAKITNTRQQGVVLPMTGSNGIVMMSVAGLALIAAGMMLAFLARRRKQTA